MILFFKTIEGETVDICAETVQLIDKGEQSPGNDHLRYQILVGEKGWCHLLSRNEYGRLHKFLKRRGKGAYPLNEVS